MRAVDPTRSTVVAWYDTLPDALARLVARVQAVGVAALGATFVPRDPAQVHATLIGLERARAPFDPGPLAAHLHAVLAQPLSVQFGGFPQTGRLRSRGLPLHDRTFSLQERGDEVGATNPTGASPACLPTSSLRQGRAVLMGWPVVDGSPSPALAEVRDGCAALGVTHRYGTDPDVYLVVADVTAAGERGRALEDAVRRELAANAVQVTLSAADLCLVTYDDPALPRASSSWFPLAGEERK